MREFNFKAAHALAALAVLALIVLCLFYRIADVPIASWDEATHIISAVEMRESGNYLITTRDGSPDYYNSKPPLGIWGVAAGMALLGESVSAVRLGSAAASLGTAALLFLLALRYAGTVPALCATLLFFSVDDMLLKHGLRSADADAYFIFFVTAGFCALSFMTSRAVYLSYFCFGLAFMCKSFHTAPFGLAAFIFTLRMARQKIVPWSTAAIAPLFFLLPVLPWAVARYSVDGHKFFARMLFYDVLERGARAVEGHQEAAHYFIRKLYSYFSVVYYAVFALFIYNRFFRARKEERAGEGGGAKAGAAQNGGETPSAACAAPGRITLMLWLWLLIPLAVYTASQSKLTWYIYPAVPALALLLTGLPALKFGPRRARALMVVAALFALADMGLALKQLKEKAEAKPQVIIAMEQIGREYRGRGDIFLDAEEGWRPDYLATARLLTGLKPESGGLDAFCRSGAERKFFILSNRETGETVILTDCESQARGARLSPAH